MTDVSRRPIEMKRKIVMLIVFVLGILFILPIEGLAWRKGTNIGGGHTSIWVGSSVGYRHGWRPYRPYGWNRPRVYVGTSFIYPWYTTSPSVIYVNPPPTVVYSNPTPQTAYAYPDPALTSQNPVDNPPGEWITIPGQWINGKWVPSHKTWVPVNP